MLKEEYNKLIEDLRSFYQQKMKSNNDIEKQEYIEAIIEEAESEDFINQYDSVELFLEDLLEKQDWTDGGYHDLMYPDVDENDEEYSEEFDPRDNECYGKHRAVLDELKDFLGLE